MRKIPNIDFMGFYEENNFVNSPLVEIPKNSGIIVDMQYYKLGMKKAISKCLVRKEVLDMLLEAKSYLPENYTFKIWDAYRPLDLQKELYDLYKNEIIREFNLENLSLEEQNEIIRKYVSMPNDNEKVPPLHTTGGAIDLTIVDLETGKDLDMGVDFDSFSPLATTAAYEEEGMDEVIRNNRRILYKTMTRVGFTNLPSEIWHYDYGDSAWAYYSEKPAIYNGIFEL